MIHRTQMLMGKSVPEAITPVVTERVTQSLAPQAYITVSEIIEELVPKHVGNRLSHDLGLLLSHSVTSSLGSCLFVCLLLIVFLQANILQSWLSSACTYQYNISLSND